MSPASAASRRVAESMHLCDNERGVDIVLLGLKQGTSLTFFVRTATGEHVPVEARFYSRRFTDWNILEVTGLLKHWEVPVTLERLTSHVMRGLALSEVIAELQMYKESNAALNVEVPNAAIVLKRINQAAFGYRNVRDFRAAAERCIAAAIYATAIVQGNPRPALAVSVALECDNNRARNLIAGARKDGYLTVGQPGVAGGRLTDKAQTLLDALRNPPLPVSATEKSGDGKNERASHREDVDSSVPRKRKAKG